MEKAISTAIQELRDQIADLRVRETSAVAELTNALYRQKVLERDLEGMTAIVAKSRSEADLRERTAFAIAIERLGVTLFTMGRETK